jgi:hypothetical protein
MVGRTLTRADSRRTNIATNTDDLAPKSATTVDEAELVIHDAVVVTVDEDNTILKTEQ